MLPRETIYWRVFLALAGLYGFMLFATTCGCPPSNAGDSAGAEPKYRRSVDAVEYVLWNGLSHG